MANPLDRKVNPRAPEVRFDGRILYLTEDPALVRSQLAGEDLAWDASIPLRNDISTDEITPGWVCYYHDETLGEFPYVGLTCEGERPIGRSDVKRGGFAVSVSGKRRGKGSSREHSPFAENVAGIQLVVAENIERIYNQNCVNLGILTSTDFSLLDRVKNGETISLSEFTRGQDEVTRQIIEYGGLFNFNLARMQGAVSVPPVATPARPMTLAEKILARHVVTDLAQDAVGVEAVQPGDSGFVRCDLRFSHEYVTPMASIFYEKLVGNAPIRDKDSVLFFRDHLTFLEMAMTQERIDQGLLEVANQLAIRQAQFAQQQGIRLHGETEAGGSEAICHSKVLQSYARPGQLIIGTDSHTPHSGALACLAFGVGTTAIFNSWVTQDTMVRVPENVRVEITGRRNPGVTAKDYILEVLRQPYVRDGQAIGKLVEYCGDAVDALSVDERATLTNMAAEIGAFTGIVGADDKTVDFLVRWRGMDRDEAEAMCAGLISDADASWAHTIHIDASQIRPMVALPGDPGRGIRVEELEAPVKIDIAYGGSCTAGKEEDMDMYARVLAEGLEHGERVHEGVTFWIQFGSQEVKEYCREKGYLDIFERAGAKVIEPSCGACINAGPGVSDNRDQVTVSAINRNFPGRSGPGQMYLASPLTVAASALAGEIRLYEEERGGAVKRIGVVRGDGVGPEVVDEGLRMLRHVAEQTGLEYELVEYPWGADHYLKTGETMPESVLSEYEDLDAILLGAIGDPRVETGLLERSIIGGIRWKLDMYINLRPVKLYHEDLCPLKDVGPDRVDMVFVRENTESLYCQIAGSFKKGTPDEITTQEMVNTRKGIERAVRYAYELAQERPRKKLTLIDKANALRSQDLWTRTFAEVGEEYPQVEQDHAYIDAACMWMVKNPEWFDVAVVDNMFGDIITDLGAMIQGGLGVAASANIHPGRVSMFEPIHGSAPKYRGKGVACPIATIAAVGMMLDFLGEKMGAVRIDDAIATALGQRKITDMSARSGLRTSQYTDVLMQVMSDK